MLGSVLSGSGTDRARERGRMSETVQPKSAPLSTAESAAAASLNCQTERERRPPRSAVAFAADGLKGKGADEDDSGKQTWSSVLYINAHLTFSFPFPPSLQVLTLHDISSFQSYEIAPNSGDGSWRGRVACRRPCARSRLRAFVATVVRPAEGEKKGRGPGRGRYQEM